MTGWESQIVSSDIKIADATQPFYRSFHYGISRYTSFFLGNRFILAGSRRENELGVILLIGGFGLAAGMESLALNAWVGEQLKS